MITAEVRNEINFYRFMTSQNKIVILLFEKKRQVTVKVYAEDGRVIAEQILYDLDLVAKLYRGADHLWICDNTYIWFFVNDTIQCF